MNINIGESIKAIVGSNIGGLVAMGRTDQVPEVLDAIENEMLTLFKQAQERNIREIEKKYDTEINALDDKIVENNRKHENRLSELRDRNKRLHEEIKNLMKQKQPEPQPFLTFKETDASVSPEVMRRVEEEIGFLRKLAFVNAGADL